MSLRALVWPVTIFAITAYAWAPDAQHGAAVLKEQNCLACHTLDAGGASYVGSMDLGTRLTPNYSPSALATVIWNHTPAMWQEMSATGMTRPKAADEDWADVFAYLNSLQSPKGTPMAQSPEGNRVRGRLVFEEKGCVDCHRTPTTLAPQSPRPQKKFTPFSMVALGWGSGEHMYQEMRHKGVAWPRLSAQDMSDLVAYVNTLSW